MTELDATEIASILKDEETKLRGGRKKKDPTEPREFSTWWKLPHKMIDQEGEPLKCEDPNCPDPRPRCPILAMVNGKYCCRYSFLAGFNRTVDASGTG